MSPPPPARPAPWLLALGWGVCVLACATPAHAGLFELKPKVEGLRYGGELATTVAPDLRMAGPYEDRFAWRNRMRFAVSYAFAKNAKFRLGARFFWTVRSGDRVEADAWLNLDDSWLLVQTGPVYWRAGVQRLKWGSNALISPLDILNPLDYSLGLATGDAEQGRINTLSLRMNVGNDHVGFEFVFLPFFQPLRVAWYGRDFAILRPGMLEGVLPGLVPGTGLGVVDDRLSGLAGRVVDGIVALDPYARDGLQSHLVAAPPEELPWNGDVGIAVDLRPPRATIGIHALWMVLDEPAVTFNPGLVGPLLGNRLPNTAELTQLTNPDEPIAATRHHRALLLGVDGEINVGSFLFSGETVFKDRSVRYTTRLEPYLSPSLQYALAWRWTEGMGWLLDVEFAHEMILRFDPDTFVQRRHDLQVALGVLARFPLLRLQLSLSANYYLLRADLYANPQVRVGLGKGFAVEVGAQILHGFRGDVEPTLDSLLSYRGGPYGYFGGNDAAYARLLLDF